MYLPFEKMPESARIWVYQSNRKFTPEEIAYASARLTAFCEQWNTHGALMPSSFELLHDQFIVLAVDESKLGASGCSIDSSVRTLREIEQKLNISLLDQGKVSFISDGQVITSKLQEVKDYIKAGNLQEDTRIFNPLINRKEDLSEKWIIPAKDSWLKKYFAN